MTNYFKHDFKLSECQQRSLIDAIRNQEPIVLRLTQDSFNGDNISLPLTSKDSKKVFHNKFPFNQFLYVNVIMMYKAGRLFSRCQ